MMKSFVFLSFLVTVANGLNFLAIGDWGGVETKPYYTKAQLDTANGMNTIGTSLNSEFVLALGDNFYHAGVTAESDQRFQTTFESVYTGKALQVNWYVIAGNHDHNGNTTAQIAYSGDSARWNFPSLYHKHSFVSKDGVTLDIIMIDTVDLASLTLKEEHEEGYFDPLPLRSKADAADQWSWIEEALKSSTADHVLVVGHYPVYSVCQHGPTATLVNNLRPLLIQYGAHYLAGHDHCMEHLTEPDNSVNYFLSGMGVECCYTASNLKKIPDNTLKWYVSGEHNSLKSTGGFTSFEVDQKGLQAIYYDQDGKVLYTAPVVPARTKKN